MTTVDASQTAADIDRPFVRILARVVRSDDSYGSWEGKTDAEILADFIVTREQRREMPIIDDPDPDVVWRVEKFYAAVGIAVEAATGRIAAPMMTLTHEGFGRLLMTTGRLVVVAKTLRDVHRFGFESFDKLADAGDGLVGEAVGMIGRYREIADL